MIENPVNKIKTTISKFFPIMKFQKQKKIKEIMHHALLDDTKWQINPIAQRQCKL